MSAPPSGAADADTLRSNFGCAGAGWGPLFAAVLLSLLVYAVTLGGTYVYDDVYIAQQDERLHDVSRWKEFWTRSYFPDALDRLYRPVTSMSYAIEWRLHGDRPWVMHLVNILCHAAVAAGVAEITRRLAGTRAAYIAGALFAVHPVHVEAVAGIVGRAELFCTLGVVYSIVLALGRLTPLRVAGLFLLCAFAILSKEQGILLPFFLALLPIPKLRRAEDEGQKRLARVAAVLLLWGVAGYIAAREYSPMKFSWDRALLDWSAQPLVRATPADQWGILLEVLGRYAVLMIWPADLSLEYGYKVTTYVARWSSPLTLIGIATAIGAAAALAACLRKRAAVPAWCILCAGAAYALVGNVTMPIGTIMGERLMYLPSVFLLILAGWVIAKLPRLPGAALVLALVLIGSARTFTYARLWNDRLTLYAYLVDRRPEAIGLYRLLSKEYSDRGDYDAVDRTLRRAREVAPDYWGIWRWSAGMAMLHGRYDDADAFLDRARQIEPTDPVAVSLMRTEVAKRRAATQRAAPATTRAATP